MIKADLTVNGNLIEVIDIPQEATELDYEKYVYGLYGVLFVQKYLIDCNMAEIALLEADGKGDDEDITFVYNKKTEKIKVSEAKGMLYNEAEHLLKIKEVVKKFYGISDRASDIIPMGIVGVVGAKGVKITTLNLFDYAKGFIMKIHEGNETKSKEDRIYKFEHDGQKYEMGRVRYKSVLTNKVLPDFTTMQAVECMKIIHKWNKASEFAKDLTREYFDNKDSPLGTGWKIVAANEYVKFIRQIAILVDDGQKLSTDDRKFNEQTDERVLALSGYNAEGIKTKEGISAGTSNDVLFFLLNTTSY